MTFDFEKAYSYYQLGFAQIKENLSTRGDFLPDTELLSAKPAQVMNCEKALAVKSNNCYDSHMNRKRSNAERQGDWLERQRRKGLSTATVIVPIDDRQKVRDYARQLRDQFMNSTSRT